MSTSRFAIVLVGVCSLAFGFAGCKSDSSGDKSSSSSSSTMGKKSLYERLGGEPAITAVCDDFIDRASKNPKVNFFRKDVPGYSEWKPSPAELAAFRKHLIQFVEVAAGGPQKYEGRSMKEVHKGQKITSAQFDAIAADLAASLDKFKVPAAEKNELLTAVAGTKKDIVEMN